MNAIRLAVLATLLAGCVGTFPPVDFSDLPDAAPDIRDIARSTDVAHSVDLASRCSSVGDYCCDNATCNGPSLVCQFTPGIVYGKCAACGDATPGPACPSMAPDYCAASPCNLADCGQPCCAGDKCASGECMTGRNLTRCIDEQRCGHEGQPCCYWSTFCAVGLTCTLTANGQTCER